MIPLLVPTLGLDISLLRRLNDSIDRDVHPVAVNNGLCTSLMGFLYDHPKWDSFTNNENIGVAASWNLAPKRWPRS